MRSMTRSSDAFRSMPEMWAQKTHEADTEERYQGILGGEQIHTPVRVVAEPDQPLEQWEGHHRIAAAALRQRRTGQAQFVPVTYHPSWDDAGQHEFGD